MADGVRTAIEARLKAWPGLTSLLGTPTGVYHGVAPQPAKPPVVVIEQRTDMGRQMFGGEGYVDETWLVRGVAFGRTADRAEDIAAQIQLALEDAPLSLGTGLRLLAVWRESGVNYPEQVGKDRFRHTGGVYRVVSQTTS